MRADPAIDGIIAQIYPDLEEYEAKEEAMIEEINKTIMKTGSWIGGVEEAKKRQARAKPIRSVRILFVCCCYCH